MSSQLLNPKYRPDIDGLRAIAVLAVVIYHAFPRWLPGGYIGVDVFFVISGYLITSIILGNIEDNKFSFSEFYSRRIRRIFPALLLVLIICYAAGWFMLLADEYAQLGKHIAAGAGFISNFVLWSEAGYFDSASHAKPLLHLWSLGIEEQFYILWPLLLYFLHSFSHRMKFNVLWVIASLAALSFLINLYQIQQDIVATFYSPITRFWELAAGGILAKVALDQKKQTGKIVFSLIDERVQLGFAVVGLILIFSAIFLLDERTLFPSYWALLPVLGTVMLVMAGPANWINRTLLSSKPFVWVGLISYPLYLWHWPLLSFAHIVESGETAPNVRILLVALSVLLAWLTYRFIEQGMRRSSLQGVKVICLVLLMIAIGVAGYYTWKNNGFHSRVSQFNSLSSALHDWDTPAGLIKEDIKHYPVYKNTRNKPAVALFGDSHAEQYMTRIKYLTQARRTKDIVQFTAGGCPPVPNVYEDGRRHCDQYIAAFEQYLQQNPSIKTIVIAACFNCYFIHEADQNNINGNNYYYQKRQGQEVGLKQYFRGGNGNELAMQSFIDFVARLANDYEVVVALDNPQSRQFNPRTLISRNGQGRKILLSDNAIAEKVTFARDSRELTLEAEIRKKLTDFNVDIVAVGDIVCPDNVCNAIDVLGRPIYRDEDHMRPFYVLTKMKRLDSYLVE